MKNGLRLNTKTLILGSTGQIGSYLKKKLKGNIKCPARKQLDLLDKKALLKYLNNFKFNLIINCAAFTDVNKCETQKKKAQILNVQLPNELSKYCKKNNAKLIHFSTNYVFDGKKKKSYTEKNRPNPINYYGKTKYLAEKKIKSIGCEYLILRVSGIYSKKFKNNFFFNILNNRKDFIKVVSDQYITLSSADFISDITLECIKSYNLINKKILHLAPNGMDSWYNYAKYVLKISNNSKKILSIKSNKFNKILAMRPKNSVICSNKIQKILNIKFCNVKKYIQKEYSNKKI